MPLPNPGKDKSGLEKQAYRRGKHDRRKGLGKDKNPFVRSDLDHEPNQHEKWIAGWEVMDNQIEAGHLDEYD